MNSNVDGVITCYAIENIQNKCLFNTKDRFTSTSIYYKVLHESMVHLSRATDEICPNIHPPSNAAASECSTFYWKQHGHLPVPRYFAMPAKQGARARSACGAEHEIQHGRRAVEMESLNPF